MKNIMKAQLYQLKKERLIYIFFILVIAILQIVVINEDGCDTFGEVMCTLAGIVPQMTMMFVFIAVGVIAGSDFRDQTCNYEILGGHTRKEVYFGRIIIALVVSVVGCLIIELIIVGIGCAMYGGFGDAVSFGGYIRRLMLMSFPYFRIACEAIGIVFIIRIPEAVMGIGVMYSIAFSEVIVGSSKHPDSFFLGFSNLVRLSTMSSFEIYNPVNPSTVVATYDTALTATDVFGTIGVSLGVGLAFLVLGYHFFKTDDIR